MKLLIAIPALNEAESIASIIERCLAARERIVRESPVTEVQITVVSDGSTDRTAEIAREYAGEIDLIVFKTNRGYGAAITEAWLQSDAELLSFLDADGTCDPEYLIPLCNRLEEDGADVVLGCRLHGQSRMPLTRRVGNTLFAWMLSALALTRVRDTASGMRIVRRSSLTKLFPLPSGLHFTPAMSARAMMSRDLRISETDMAYQERTGASKLSPAKDGLRFLWIILKTALLYRPSRPLGLVAVALLALTGGMLACPLAYYVQHGELQEWMIYRFLVGELFSTVSVSMLCLAYVGSKAADVSLSDDPAGEKYHGLLGRFFGSRWFWLAPTGCLLLGGGLVFEALANFLTTGMVTEHWSRFVAMMFCLSVAAVLVVTKVVDYCLNLLADRLAFHRQLVEPCETAAAEVKLKVYRHAA